MAENYHSAFVTIDVTSFAALQEHRRRFLTLTEPHGQSMTMNQ
jgi:hypothetical protein